MHGIGHLGAIPFPVAVLTAIADVDELAFCGFPVLAEHICPLPAPVAPAAPADGSCRWTRTKHTAETGEVREPDGFAKAYLIAN